MAVNAIPKTANIIPKNSFNANKDIAEKKSFNLPNSPLNLVGKRAIEAAAERFSQDNKTKGSFMSNQIRQFDS